MRKEKLMREICKTRQKQNCLLINRGDTNEQTMEQKMGIPKAAVAAADGLPYHIPAVRVRHYR